MPVKIATIVIITGMGLLGLAAVTGACLAMSPRPQAGAKPPAEHMSCFDPTFIDGFQPAGDNKIVVTEGRNRVYELTMGGVCIGLDTTFAVGIRSRTGMNQVCGPFDADLVFRDMGGLDRRQACPITEVRLLTGAEAAKYVDAPRKDSKDKK